MTDFLVVTAVSAAAVMVLQGLTCAVSLRTGTFRVVDQVWGAGIAVIAVLCALLGNGDPARRWALAVLVAVWGIRLSVHIFRRSRGTPEDPRYAEMLAGRSRMSSCLHVFGLQGVAQWFVALPIQVAAVTGPALGWARVAVVLGIALAVGGMATEAVADRQMQRYKNDPDRGEVMDRGLWGWSRHPNYFGDAVLWVGVFLVAAAVWPGLLTALSPIAMVWFLVVATGARRLERHMAGRPGYGAYRARTSFFVPLPPRGRRATAS